MLGKGVPTVRSRELGLALSRAAAAKGLRNRDLARALRWSDSKVSRIFGGTRRPSIPDVAAILALCGVIGPRRDELFELAEHAHEPGWWQDYGDRLPIELTTLSDNEDAATAITCLETQFVPGLLQTDDYMRAVMRANPVIPDTEIGVRAEARKRRQEILSRGSSGPRITFYINEYALTRTGPGRTVMAPHIQHLLHVCVRHNVEIRVIPDAVGFHAGQRSFHMSEFAELHPVVHIEDMTSSQFLERPDTIGVYRRVVADLDRVALDQDHSRAWLRSLATSLAHGDGNAPAVNGSHGFH